MNNERIDQLINKQRTLNYLLLFTAGSCFAYVVSYCLAFRPLGQRNAQLKELLVSKDNDLYLKANEITKLTIQNARLREELLEQVERQNEE